MLVLIWIQTDDKNMKKFQGGKDQLRSVSCLFLIDKPVSTSGLLKRTGNMRKNESCYPHNSISSDWFISTLTLFLKQNTHMYENSNV